MNHIDEWRARGKGTAVGTGVDGECTGSAPPNPRSITALTIPAETDPRIPPPSITNATLWPSSRLPGFDLCAT